MLKSHLYCVGGEHHVSNEDFHGILRQQVVRWWNSHSFSTTGIEHCQAKKRAVKKSLHND